MNLFRRKSAAGLTKGQEPHNSAPAALAPVDKRFALVEQAAPAREFVATPELATQPAYANAPVANAPVANAPVAGPTGANGASLTNGKGSHTPPTVAPVAVVAPPPTVVAPLPTVVAPVKDALNAAVSVPETQAVTAQAATAQAVTAQAVTAQAATAQAATAQAVTEEAVTAQAVTAQAVTVKPHSHENGRATTVAQAEPESRLSATLVDAAVRLVDGNHNTQPVISVRDIKKIYRMGDVEVAALQGVDIDIYPGEVTAIMGPSGSGKSTLMNIIGCLDVPSEGSYLLDGTDVSKLNDDQLAAIRCKKIGFVFQSFNLLSRTTAQANVELPLIYAGIGGGERSRRAKSVLTLVGLEKRMHHKPNELSGGQQQRVAIARALINEPAMILADEPTGNLDSKTSVEIMELFQRLNVEQGITIVFVTHNNETADYCHRTIRVRDGLVEVDQRHRPVAGIYSDPAIQARLAQLPDPNLTASSGRPSQSHPGGGA